MTRDNIDAAGACADLISRGIPPDVASETVMRLTGLSGVMRLAHVAPLLFVTAPGTTHDDCARWLRRYGYLPEPTRCRWCGSELHARSHVAVQVDGIACAKCALSRGVS